ncbi:hypothetical protein [Alteribacter aurantiacus]|uniref:hypothetical protein n=1 Tax=Alteribacter aurantiacus TaxID=254410 RepID=UPI000402FF83|nr:hypothetical protein [Alteribacter aurantiacus]
MTIAAFGILLVSIINIFLDRILKDDVHENKMKFIRLLVILAALPYFWILGQGEYPYVTYGVTALILILFTYSAFKYMSGRKINQESKERGVK